MNPDIDYIEENSGKVLTIGLVAMLFLILGSVTGNSFFQDCFLITVGYGLPKFYRWYKCLFSA